MNELRQSVRNQLIKYHSSVYYEQAPNNANFPFVVFLLSNTTMIDDLEMLKLDVNVYSNQSVSELETIAESIWQGLKRYTETNAYHSLTIHKDRRITLEEEDKSIKRRLLTFNVRYMTKEV